MSNNYDLLISMFIGLIMAVKAFKMQGNNMRNVTSQELNTVSGAVLYIDDLAINVPSTGIPSTHFYHIEFGYQLFLDGAWDQKTLLEYYVKNSVSMNSLKCYTDNFENATFTVV